MTVIVRCDGNIILLTKGENTKVEKALAKDQPFLAAVKSNSQKFSEMGLRVLWVAMKVIDEDEFSEWKERFDEIEGDDEKGQDVLVAEIEEGLTLIGCTAVEDNLQDKVPETISDLQLAGINIWVLTGDNLPTAKNITISCKLLPPDMEIYEIYEDLEKYKKFVLAMSNDKQIFQQNNIEKAIELISNFEKDFPQVYMGNAPKVPEALEEYLEKLNQRKGILYIGLKRMLEYYKESEKKIKIN